jgi:hypothetical protein
MPHRPRRATVLAALIALGPAATAQPWRRPPPTPRPLAVGPLVLDERPAAGRVPLALRSSGVPQHVVIEARGRATEREGGGVLVRAAGACNTPCQLWVPTGTLRLRSEAPGLRSTDLDVDVDAATTLEVRAPSSGLFNLGTGLAAAGAAVMVVTATVALSQQIGDVSRDEQIRPEVAVTLSLVGALVLAAGIPFLVAHRMGVRRVATP